MLANPPPWRQQLQLAGAAAGTGVPSSQQDAPGSMQEGAPAQASDSEAAEAAAGSEAPAVPAASGSASGGASGGGPPRGGTLVVCPPALLQQWQSELGNHAHGALSVEVYDGLRGLAGTLAAEGGAAKRLKPAQREMEL